MRKVQAFSHDSATLPLHKPRIAKETPPTHKRALQTAQTLERESNRESEIAGERGIGFFLKAVEESFCNRE